MRETRGALIVNVSSVSAFTGSGSSIAYCAAKAALINLYNIGGKQLVLRMIDRFIESAPERVEAARLHANRNDLRSQPPCLTLHDRIAHAGGHRRELTGVIARHDGIDRVPQRSRCRKAR